MFDRLEFDLNDLGFWYPTVAGLREAILAFRIVGPDDPASPRRVTGRELDSVVTMSVEAVTAGRLFDLGLLPNEVIGACGKRGGALWDADALIHPFEDPWMFCHSWTMADDVAAERPAVALYLVNPCDDGHCEVVELQPCTMRGAQVLLLHDRAILYRDRMNNDPARYRCQVVPSSLRYIHGYNRDATPEHAAAGNVLDPLMAALVLLNTDGVHRETVQASEKLNKARLKSRKQPIPPYERIDSSLYVTAVKARLDRTHREPGGGHHASPVPHVRRRHTRTYASGDQTIIRETLVRVTPEAREHFLSRRSHYEVK